MKKILYIKAQGMGDIIASIPKWHTEKIKDNEIYVLYYDFHYFGNFLYKTDYVQDLIKMNNIIKDILYIPYGKFSLFWFILKNFRAFDEVLIPIKTRWNVPLGFLLGKKCTYTFSHLNDISKYKNLIAGELNNKELPLIHYKNSFLIPEMLPEFIKEDIVDLKYITIFPSSYERSINATEWKKIIKYITDQGITIILIGGTRESYLAEDLSTELESNPLIKNGFGNTNLNELAYLLVHSILNISCNGGVMWLGHLLNTKNISIQTVSSFTMEPPVDDINSFNVRPYKYPECQPCEAGFYRYDKIKGIPSCKFYNTKREGECRFIQGEIIIDTIKKCLN